MAGRALLLSTPALNPLTQQLCSLPLFRDRDAAFLKGGGGKIPNQYNLAVLKNHPSLGRLMEALQIAFASCAGFWMESCLQDH